LKAEANSYRDLPLIAQVSIQMVNENFRRIKTEVGDIIENEIERILNTPGLEKL
jgi:hypothetical protein